MSETSAEKLVKQTIKLIGKNYDLDYENLKISSKKVIKLARNYDSVLLGMMEELLDFDLYLKFVHLLLKLHYFHIKP